MSDFTKEHNRLSNKNQLTEVGLDLPHSQDMERAVLGAILVDDEPLGAAIQIIAPEDFYSARNKTIFKAMISLLEANEPLDLVTMKEILKRQGSLESVGGAAYLSGLIDGRPKSKNLETYAKHLTELRARRRLIMSLHGVEQQCYLLDRPFSEIVGEVHDQVLSCSQNGVGRAGPRMLLISEFLEDPEVEMELIWVWKGYLPEGTVCLLSGDAKAGKTTLAARLAIAVASGSDFLGLPTGQGPVGWVGLGWRNLLRPFCGDSRGFLMILSCLSTW